MNVYFQSSSKALIFTVNSGYVTGQILSSHDTFKRMARTYIILPTLTVAVD